MGPHIRGILLGLQEQEAQRLAKRSHLNTVVAVGAETCYIQFSPVFVHFLAEYSSIHPPKPIHPPVHLPTHSSTQPPTYLPTQPPTYTPIPLSLQPSTHISTAPLTHPCIYPPIYTPIPLPISPPTHTDYSPTHPFTKSLYVP